MKIGTKIVLMRGKRYGIFNAGRYEDVLIATLESISHNGPGTQYHFATRKGPQVMTEENHTKRWPEGWNPVYIDPEMPRDEDIAEKLMSAIDALHYPGLIHIGLVTPDLVLGTLMTRDSGQRFGFGNDHTNYQTIIVENVEAKPGDLIVGKINHAAENDVGQPRFFVNEHVVIAEGLHLDAIYMDKWPADKLMSEHDLEEHLNRMTLAKDEDYVLFHADGNDVSVIASSGLRAHESGDISSDAWHWGMGEAPGLYVARDLSWTGSGEDVELEANVIAASDEEVTRIMIDQGMGSSELVDHELDDAIVMRIATRLGDEDQARARIKELEDKAREQEAAAA